MPDSTNLSGARVYVGKDEDDLALVGRCLDEGDASAFEALVVRYQRPFFTFAVRVLGDREEASDAVQNTFVKVFQKLATFDRSRKFFSWAYRILVNECLNMRRSRRPSEPLDADFPAEGSPIDAVERAERNRLVQAAILDLPPDYRTVVVLKYFSHLGYADIAEALGIPQNTVKSRLYTARERLAAALLACGTRK